MNTHARRPDDIRRARRAFLLVGLIAPIIITAVAIVLIVIWLPDLPDRVITHWGPNGPDGFGSPVVYVWIQVIVGLSIPLLMTLPVLATMRESWGVTCRFLGAMSLGVSVLIAIASAGSVAIQRGDADGSGASAVLAFGFAGMVVFGLIGWLLQPRVTTTQASGRAAHLDLAPGERAAWFGTASMGRTGIVSLVLAVLILIVTTVWGFMMDPGAGWILAIVTALVIVLIATTLVFRIRVSADGLRVHSIAGWPRWRIPASEITDARAVQVNPMAEFGGWGVRFAVDGRMGVVLRTGEGLQVTRRSGRTFVVTTDDAATAASVLSTAVKGVKS